MNTPKMIMALICALSLTACSTNGYFNLANQCVFSDDSEAPPWTCNSDAVLNIDELKNITWVVGQAKKIPAGKRLQKRTAILDARATLLNQIAARVESLLQIEARGSEAQDAITEFTQSFSEGILSGTKPYSTAIDPENGEMFILVGLSDEQFKQNIQANKQYQELKEAILAQNGQEIVNRIDSGLDRLSEAKKNIGLEGARKIASERTNTTTQ